jgi:hypothetical protein
MQMVQDYIGWTGWSVQLYGRGRGNFVEKLNLRTLQGHYQLLAQRALGTPKGLSHFVLELPYGFASRQLGVVRLVCVYIYWYSAGLVVWWGEWLSGDGVPIPVYPSSDIPNARIAACLWVRTTALTSATETMTNATRTNPPAGTSDRPV